MKVRVRKEVFVYANFRARQKHGSAGMYNGTVVEPEKRQQESFRSARREWLRSRSRDLVSCLRKLDLEVLERVEKSNLSGVQWMFPLT